MNAKRMRQGWAKVMIVLMPLVGGTLLGTCYDTVTLVNPCGGNLLTEDVCSEQDWWNWTFAGRTAPDYDFDPSCTIPGQCGANDLYPPNDPFGGGGGGG